MKRKKTKKLPAVRDTQNDAVRLRAFQHITNHKKRRFLVAYVEAGTLRGAALLAGGAKGLWRSHYNWLTPIKSMRRASSERRPWWQTTPRTACMNAHSRATIGS